MMRLDIIVMDIAYLMGELGWNLNLKGDTEMESHYLDWSKLIVSELVPSKGQMDKVGHDLCLNDVAMAMDTGEARFPLAKESSPKLSAARKQINQIQW